MVEVHAGEWCRGTEHDGEETVGDSNTVSSCGTAVFFPDVGGGGRGSTGVEAEYHVVGTVCYYHV